MRVGRALFGLAAVAAALPCLDGALVLLQSQGLSSFGRPAWLGWGWVLAGLACAVTVARATDRLSAARCLTLLLLAATCFGQSALPAAPGALLLLSGAALLVALPLLVATPGQAVTVALLLLALPACLASSHPMGVLQWLAAILPPAALVALIPACWQGRDARGPALTLLATTAFVCLGALSDLPLLAQRLDLPLAELSSTRLRPMTLHPNLAVPSVALATLLGVALLWSASGRRAALLALLLPLFVTLAAMQSKTGTLATAAGLVLLAALRARWPLAPLVPWALRIAVLAALLVPASGLTDATITHRSASMVSKAVSFRSAMWQLGRDTWAAAPFQGNGPRTYHMQGQQARPSRYDGLPKDDHPHNVVLAVGAGLGWPGLLGLALLLAASLRRVPGQSLLADGALVAAALHWGANGVDMGGAVASLLPAGVFPLLGLADAARRANPMSELGNPPPGFEPGLALPSFVRSALGLGAAASLLLGGLMIAQAQVLTRSERSAAEGKLDDATRAGQWAARLIPWDPRPPLLLASVASQTEDAPAALAALERAAERAPSLSRIVHALAVARSRVNLDDPRVPQLLDRALAMDPYGPDAWRVHLDRALLAAHARQQDPAFAHLVDSVLLNPAAVSRLTFSEVQRSLRLSADGRTGVELALDRVLAEIGRRREALVDADSAQAARLRLREVDVLLALGLSDDADVVCRDLLAAEPMYLHVRLGQSALARGDVAAAAQHYQASGQASSSFEPMSISLLALAETLDPGSAEFETRVAAALPLLPDISFESASVRRLTEARLIMAKRRGQTEQVRQLELALAYLDG